jgi:general secretion pathway protein I
LNTRAYQRGFTLVEILVSLAILSIILGALVQSAGVATSNAGRMRDRTIAEWVATNRLAELRLSPSFPETGSKSGEEEMFGKPWYWKTIVQKVEDDDLRRVDVEVRSSEDSENPLITIAGFVSHPRLKARSTAARQ